MITRLTSPRWHDVLLELRKSPDKERYCERLNRRVKASLTQVREIVRLLAQHDLIAIMPANKIKYLLLTDRGISVSGLLFEIRSVLGNSIQPRSTHFRSHDI